MGLTGILTAGLLFLAAAPSSTNFTLKAFDIGSGGGSQSSSSYKLNSTTGNQTGPQLQSSSYSLSPGQQPNQHAFGPSAPTFTNPATEYNRLKIVLNVGTAPSDTKYLIAISSDSFATTYYVQTDNSIALAKSISNYQSYTSWGGASGVYITGLTSNTAYLVKVKALQGNFSETAYSPTASASTSVPTISFGVGTSAGPPSAVSFSSLTAGSVIDTTTDAVLTISTNALNGGNIYLNDTNAALHSTAASATLSSVSGDLTSATKGYGAIVISASQTSGGPLASTSPYNSTGNTVGVITTALQSIGSTSLPINSGILTVRLKAKADSILPSATDYADTLVFTAAVLF